MRCRMVNAEFSSAAKLGKNQLPSLVSVIICIHR